MPYTVCARCKDFNIKKKTQLYVERFIVLSYIKVLNPIEFKATGSILLNGDGEKQL